MRKSITLKYLIIGLILLIVFIFTLINISKYRFGYFKEEGNLNFIHPDADAFSLDDDRIIILGDSFNNIPSEVYSIKNKKATIYKFTGELDYKPEGFLLNKGNLFLLRTCIKQKCGMSVVYDINKNKIVHAYMNTFDVNNVKLNNSLQNYLLLNDKNVFYIAYKHANNQSEIGFFDITQQKKNSIISNENLLNAKSIQINDNQIFIMTINNAYIYDTKNLKLNKLDFPYKNLINPINNTQKVSHLVKLKDKIIIYIYLMNNKYKYYNLTLSFDLNTHKFNQLSSSSILRDYNFMDNWNYVSNVIKLDEEYILVNGGVSNVGIIRALFGGHYTFKKSAEIYDISKNKFYKIVNMPYAKFGHRAIPINNKETLLYGGITKKVIGSLYSDEPDKIIMFKRF